MNDRMKIESMKIEAIIVTIFKGFVKLPRHA